MATKQIVQYKDLQYCKVGESAIVWPVDHPGPLVSNTKWVITSPVQRYVKELGMFETLNTLYMPEEKV